jgi:glycosyltransferase 2 family protein
LEQALLRDKKFWIGVLISVFFLYLAFREENFGQIAAALGKVQYWALIPALVFYFAGVWIRAVRWGVLLSPLRRGIHPYHLFKVLVIGYMGNDILPARLGDVIRVYVLSRRERVTKSATLATILVERIFDGLTMIGFLTVSALFIALNSEMTTILRVTSALFVAGLLVFIFLAASPDRITTMVRLILGRSPIGSLIPVALHERALHMTSSFVEGLAVLRSWRGVLSVMGLSVAAWAAEATMYYIIGAWGFGLTLPVHAYTITTAAANLGTLVPSSPGYIGVFDGIAKVVLAGLFKIDSSLALSYVVVLHAALYFPVTIWGLFYMARESVSWRELAALEKKEAAGEAGTPDDDENGPGGAPPAQAPGDAQAHDGSAVEDAGPDQDESGPGDGARTQAQDGAQAARERVTSGGSRSDPR